MKKNRTRLLLLVGNFLIGIHLSAQDKPSKILYFDKDYKPDTKKSAFYEQEIIYYNDTTTIVRTYKKNGPLIKEITFKDTALQIKHGYVAEYDMDAKYLTFGTSNIAGYFSKLKVFGQHSNNKKDGLWFMFNDTFKIKSVVKFKEDKITEKVKGDDFFDKTTIEETNNIQEDSLEINNQKNKPKQFLIDYDKKLNSLILKKLKKEKVYLPDYSHIFILLIMEQSGSVNFNSLLISNSRKADYYVRNFFKELPSVDLNEKTNQEKFNKIYYYYYTQVQKNGFLKMLHGLSY